MAKAKSTYVFNDITLLIVIIVVLLIVIFVSTYYINGNSMLENFARPSGSNGSGTWAVEYYYSNDCSSCNRFDNTGNWEALKSKYNNKFRFDKFLNTSTNGSNNVKRYNITSYPAIVISRNQYAKVRYFGSLEDRNALENFIKDWY
jgi:hypothetical protein